MPTENMQIGQSSDDAEETYSSGGSMDLVAPYIRMYIGTDAYGGFRFVPDSSIPQGATIDSADLQWQYTTTSYDSETCVVYAEDAASPGTFTTTAYDISGRSATTENINIADVDVGVDWQHYDVADIIQELVDSYTVQSIVIVAHDATGTGPARIRTWDADTALAAKLDVIYTVAGAEHVPPRRHNTLLRM